MFVITNKGTDGTPLVSRVSSFEAARQAISYMADILFQSIQGNKKKVAEETVKSSMQTVHTVILDNGQKVFMNTVENPVPGQTVCMVVQDSEIVGDFSAKEELV